MHKQDVAAAYIAIETRYPLKADRNKKLNDLIVYLQTDNICFSLQEIEKIIHTIISNSAIIRMPFFSKVLYPVIHKNIEAGEARAVKIFLKLFQQLYQYQNFTKQHTYTESSLLRMGLQFNPDDKEFLLLYEENTRRYLGYTLHELPDGILYGANSSDIQECDELLELLARYEQTCHKLQVHHSALIDQCRFYYLAYKSYLINKKLYHNFKEYLAKNSEQDK